MISKLYRRIESNADLVKWGVHSLGPDEWDAAPSHAAAVARANAINRQVHAAIMASHHKSDNTILCFAYAAPWPFNWPAESHDESLKNWDAELKL